MATKQTVKDLTVGYAEGAAITLPITNGKQMTYDEAIMWFQRKKEEEETVVAIHHEFACSPLDGLVALQRVLAKRFGWTQNVAKQTWFGPQPPTMIGIHVGVDTIEQVMYGVINIPGVEGQIETLVTSNPPAFQLGGHCKKKNEPQVLEIVNLVREYLKTNSIYRGKAVTVDFSWDRPDAAGRKRGYHFMNDAPQFFPLDPNLETELVFSDAVNHQLNLGLWTPIEYSDACRQYNFPLNRGVLLGGPFGTGKTLTSHVSFIKGTRNGWTSIYLKDARDLKRGLEFARQYAPAILFCEDVDRVTNGGRSAELDEILNTLDGVNTKGAEIITVFTTNDVESINPALLRPGRIDVYIDVQPPDAAAVMKLVSLYSRGLMAKGEKLDTIGKRLAGRIPAFVREVVERSKAAAIFRLKGQAIEGHVTEADMLAAADAMDGHNSLFQVKAQEIPENIESVMLKVPVTSKAGQSLLKNLPKYAGGLVTT